MLPFNLDICPYYNNYLWSYFSGTGHCYSNIFDVAGISQYMKPTWSVANILCLSMKSWVVTIESEQEMNFTINNVFLNTATGYTWLGGRYDDGVKP